MTTPEMVMMKTAVVTPLGMCRRSACHAQCGQRRKGDGPNAVTAEKIQ
jgi:hypothetical protein